jgi:hypothetical protein
VELVDTQDLKSCVFADVRVQVPSGVQDIKQDVYKLNVSFLKSGTYTILLSNNGKKLAQNRLVVTP